MSDRQLKRFRVDLGPMPQAIVAVAAILAAVQTWPSDLAWAFFALAALAVLMMKDWHMDFDPPGGSPS